ncbi:MAG TPA: ABATE domain-containing protein [Pyrinomonadaceae bacterium]|jgi:predicted RNA-binding Zn ribbon-like protein
MFETEKFSLIANNLFLDFVNTLKARDGQSFETLDNFTDFLAWTIAAGLLSRTEVETLFRNWRDKAEARDFVSEAVEFRNVLRAAAESIAKTRKAPANSVSAINERLKKPSGYTEIERTEIGFEKRFRFDLSEPANLLQPIAEAAADFLCYANFDLLRKCESDSCVLYFYDTTKNRRRRWCSMSGCGNKAKAAAFYRRKKQTAEAENL